MAIECCDDDIGVTELWLSNGMHVAYKSTDFNDNKVLIKGYAYGGLSQVPESDYLSCVLGSTIAAMIGLHGDRASALMQKQAARMPQFAIQLTPYTRAFEAVCTATATQIEILFQLVYQLFTSEVPSLEEGDYMTLMENFKKSVGLSERKPGTAFFKRVAELKHGNSYFLRPTSMDDLKTLDLRKGLEYISKCFKDPSTYTLVIVGNFDPETANNWMVKYLGGIPSQSEPILKYNPNELKGIPCDLPTTSTREVVCEPMVEEQCHVELSFPFELTDREKDYDLIYIINKLLKK